MGVRNIRIVSKCNPELMDCFKQLKRYRAQLISQRTTRRCEAPLLALIVTCINVALGRCCGLARFQVRYAQRLSAWKVFGFSKKTQQAMLRTLLHYKNLPDNLLQKLDTCNIMRVSWRVSGSAGFLLVFAQQDATTFWHDAAMQLHAQNLLTTSAAISSTSTALVV